MLKLNSSRLKQTWSSLSESKFVAVGSLSQTTRFKGTTSPPANSFPSPINPHNYTQELYKQNFIKYPTQSQVAISHDYVYHGDERLPTLQERLEEFKNPFDEYRKNIGQKSQNEETKREELFKKTREMLAKYEANKTNKQLEIEAKEMKLKTPIDQIEKNHKEMSQFENVFRMAEHYNINNDLFDRAYFRPVCDLQVAYDNQSVYYGNRIQAEKTRTRPSVKWNYLAGSASKSHHTLLFVNLDGNFVNSQRDVLLWSIANIKNNEVKSGTELIEYLQPTPMRGTGWHRCAFVLFEHDSPIDFNLNELVVNDGALSKRSFKVADFYKKYQDKLTPVGLSFYQTEWDLSVRAAFHNILNMKEPVYEFQFEDRFLPRFEKYPENQPFNWYLQEYMDKKDLNEQVLKSYLKELSPFESYPEPAKYKLLRPSKRTNPRWYKYEQESRILRKHQYSMIPFEHYSPREDKLNEYINSLPFQAPQNKANK